MISSILRNLVSGLKLALIMPVRLRDFRPGLVSSFLLLALGIGVLAAFSYVRQDGDVYVNGFGAALLGTSLLAGVLFALVMTRVQGSLERLPDILTVLFSALPWMIAGLSGLRAILDPFADNGTHWAMALLWCVAIVVRATQIVFERASTAALLGTAALGAGLGLGSWHLGLTPELFYSYYSDEWDRYADLNQEEVFTSQSKLLDEKLEQVASSRPGETEFYFIGFAGNGDETVFASEAHFVRERVDEKFASAGRSLVLASGFEELATEPLANTHNLFRSISRIAEKIDVEDDILFLFLTSHGSEDATLDVSLFPLQLKALSAADLQRALDTAGIQWRIIVISSCYSGSFIEPLKSARTIIMTASSAQKPRSGVRRTVT